MKALINKLIENMSQKKIAIIMGLFLVVFWIIDYSPLGVAKLLQITDGVSILDYETRYTADFAYNWLKAMGDAGRHFHLTRIMPLDIIFPPCFALMQFSLLALFMKKTTNRDSNIRYFALAPFLYMLLDWLENIGITAMLISFPNRLDTIAVATGWVTSIKKTVILIDIILFVSQIVLLFTKAFRKKA